MKFDFSRFVHRISSLKTLFLTSLIIALCVFSAFAAGDDVQEADGENLRLLAKQAEKLKRRGEFVESEKLYRKIAEKNPQNIKVRLDLAFVLTKQKRLLEAYEIVFPIVKADPKNSDAFAVLGTVFLNAGNFKEAKICFGTALTVKRDNALAWAGFGMLDFYENKIEQSIENLQAAAFIEPREADYIFTLAQVSSRAEKYKEAAEYYEKFLQIAPPADTDRRDRIRGLVNFLRYLGNRSKLYAITGETETKVNIRLLRDRPVIQIRLRKDAEPLNFVLDTGSGISVISTEASERFGIKQITKGGMARAIGGEGKFEIVYGFIPSVYLGEVKIENVPVYIRKFHSNDEKIDGYIGLGLISKFLTTLDYGEQTFTLVKRTEKDSDSLSARKTQPLRLTTSGYLSGEVQLEGVGSALNFIVDTGASISVISDDLATSGEMGKHISEEKMRVVGAAGVTENVSSFLLPKMSFGEHSREKIKAIALDLDIINETSGFEQAGILGGNFLKNYRLTFDFKKSLVLFEPAGTRVNPVKP